MLTSWHMLVSRCKMHTICTKKPLPTLNGNTCPSLVLQLTVAIVLHSRNAAKMKTLWHSYVAYAHKFLVWILNVMEGHQFKGILHSTPTIGDIFFGMCREDTERLLGLTTYFNAHQRH